MRTQERRSVSVAVGIAASALLASLIALPLVKPNPGKRAQRPATATLASAAARDAELRAEALSAATSLAATLTELARLRQRRAQSRAPSGPPVEPPPSAAAFSSTGACLASFLPKLDPLRPDDLEFICKQSNLWAIERQAQRSMAGKPGAAAQLWKRLGFYELSALAVMRSGCCPEAEPLTAVVPGLWCGILRDKVRLFSAMPERSTVADFERTMTCLARRGAVLPAHWATVPAGRGQRAFEEFLTIAWARR
jgi:hypothetical protein